MNKSRRVPASMHSSIHQCVAFQRLHSSSDCCHYEQFHQNWSSMRSSQMPSPVRHCTRPPQHRSVQPSGKTVLESKYHAQYSHHHLQPLTQVQCHSSLVRLASRFLNTIYGAFSKNVPTILNGRVNLYHSKGFSQKPGGMPLKACDSFKVMLITIAFCLTVSSSSCQTLYSVIGECMPMLIHFKCHPLQFKSKCQLIQCHLALRRPTVYYLTGPIPLIDYKILPRASKAVSQNDATLRYTCKHAFFGLFTLCGLIMPLRRCT